MEAAEEPEGESEESEQAEPEEEGATSEPRFTVKVDGQEIEVTQTELLNGYQRQADYTRKTQSFAQEKQQAQSALQSEYASLRQERAQLAQALQFAQQQLLTEREPDWAKLKAEDPLGYLDARDQWRDRREKLQAYAQQQAQLHAANDAAEYENLSQTVQSENAKLLAAIPEWKDPEKSKSERAAIREFAKQIGYSDEELSQAYDHRAVLVLRDAMAYRSLMQKKQAVVQQAPKVAKPGVTPVKGSDAKRAFERFKKSRHVDDAAELILQSGLLRKK